MAVIRGTKGDDRLRGTFDADIISGRAGDDTIDPGLGPDRIDGGRGDDVIRFTALMSSSPPPEDGAISGGAGIDTIDLSSVSPGFVTMSDDVIYVTVGTQRFRTDGIEIVQFGANNDSIAPNIFYEGAAIALRAGAGNDSLNGGGNYGLYGEDGDDQVFLSGSFDAATFGIADGGTGTDDLGLNLGFTVDLAAGTAQSYQASYAIAGFETVSAYSDSIVFGDDSANVIGVREIFDSTSGHVRFEGRGGNDRLTGSLGADALDGGAGADIIAGGEGSDTLSGGGGRDLFVLREGDSLTGAADRITDFKVGSDRIDLSAIDAKSGTAAPDTFTFIGDHAFSGAAGELRFAIEGATTVVEGDTNGDGKADLSIALDGARMLDATSFVLTDPKSASGPETPYGVLHLPTMTGGAADSALWNHVALV